jgi:monofunctional biosynthetic peptidoglycan transglycosylase
LGRTIVDDAARVNCAQPVSGCLKTVEKIRDYQTDNGPAPFRARNHILRIARNLVLILLAVLLLPYLLAPLYRAGHPVSALMAWRYLKGAPVSRQWVDLSAMAPALPRSVVASEDAKFCSHRGVDWGALREVIDDAEEGEPSRGGSTITQQVAKNLFLWPGRSVIRKALELPLALWIDFVLPKPRILEIYLNIAELGPTGQFGVQSGSLNAFGHGASALTPREAALIAAILPNPHARSARTPGPGVRRLAGIYMARGHAAELRRCWSENRAF